MTQSPVTNIKKKSSSLCIISMVICYKGKIILTVVRRNLSINLKLCFLICFSIPAKVKDSLAVKVNIPRLHIQIALMEQASQCHLYSPLHSSCCLCFVIRPSQYNVSFPIALSLVKVGRSVGQK